MKACLDGADSFRVFFFHGSQQVSRRMLFTYSLRPVAMPPPKWRSKRPLRPNRQNRDLRKIFVKFRDGFQPFVFRHEKIGDDQIRLYGLEMRIPSLPFSAERLMAAALSV